MFALVQLYSWCTPVYTNNVRSQTKSGINKCRIYVIFKLFPNIWITWRTHFSTSVTAELIGLLMWILSPFQKRKKNLWSTKKIAGVGWKQRLCKQRKGPTLENWRKAENHCLPYPLSWTWAFRPPLCQWQWPWIDT